MKTLGTAYILYKKLSLVSSNLANYHATVQKLLIRQVQTDGMKLEV